MNTPDAISANSTPTTAMKIANTRIMKPIKANRLSSIVLILLDILAESDKRYYLSPSLDGRYYIRAYVRPIMHGAKAHPDTPEVDCCLKA
jgi:hypothetical protein